MHCSTISPFSALECRHAPTHTIAARAQTTACQLFRPDLQTLARDREFRRLPLEDLGPALLLLRHTGLDDQRYLEYTREYDSSTFFFNVRLDVSRSKWSPSNFVSVNAVASPHAGSSDKQRIAPCPARKRALRLSHQTLLVGLLEILQCPSLILRNLNTDTTTNTKIYARR
jgi:hypothetical protein